MTPGEWARVKEVLQATLERDPSERTAFLDLACAGDPKLRRRVETLATSDQSASEFLSEIRSAMAATVELADIPQPLASEGEPGRRIGVYQILREIAQGGMGTVYLAERADGQYRKRVALKLVNPCLDSKEILRRFRKERQVEAALEHPNIVRLLDGGATEGGLPYLVMEYVDGERIDHWCDRRKLTVRDRLRLFQKVCAALQYAHEKQVIHRDIKPGNVLVTTDGTPKLLDFGIAKVLDCKLSEPGETTVGPGPMTLEYASPEQVRGERAGPASDIYALGVMLYQLLTGQLPYSIQGMDTRKFADAICEQDALAPSRAISRAQQQAMVNDVSAARGDSPAGLRRMLTGALDNIVLKALRKEPERRYLSAAALSCDVECFLNDQPVSAHAERRVYRGLKLLKRNRGYAIAALLSALIVLALVAAFRQFTAPGDGVGVPSIAVLPLGNLSGDRNQEYFAEGITDALINEMAQIRGLRVISRTSVSSYKGMHRPLPEIARGLGVQTIAEGSVLRSGNRVRITMRLVDASNDRPLWIGSYDGEIQDVLALQARLARAIAEEIHVTLSETEKGRVFRSRRVDLAAYDAYLKGRHQFVTEFSDPSIQKAIGWFQRALALDPSYAPAYAGLADCYYMVSNQYYPPMVVMPKAKWAAMKAIELDDTLGEAHATLALVRSLYEFNREEAEKGFKRALELKPSDAEAHLWYGLYLAAGSRFDEAVAEVAAAQKLDPVSPAMNTYVGPVLYVAHRYDNLIDRLRPIAEMHPDLQQAHAFLALAYEQKSEWMKAIPEMERAYELEKEPESLAQLGHMYAVSGRTADARTVLKQLKELSKRRFVTAYDVALVYAGLGERDKAFEWFNKVGEDRSEWFAYINVDPRLDDFHSDARFVGLLRSVGLRPKGHM